MNSQRGTYSFECMNASSVRTHPSSLSEFRRQKGSEKHAAIVGSSSQKHDIFRVLCAQVHRDAICGQGNGLLCALNRERAQVHFHMLSTVGSRESTCLPAMQNHEYTLPSPPVPVSINNIKPVFWSIRTVCSERKYARSPSWPKRSLRGGFVAWNPFVYWVKSR